MSNSSMTIQQQDLMDMTFVMAQAFSDIESMKRVFLIIDQKTLSMTKTETLSDKHITNAMSNKAIIVDLKSQQVFDYERADWKDITEERETGNARKATSRRTRQGSKKAKGKKGASCTNRKTRGSTRRKRTDVDET